MNYIDEIASRIFTIAHGGGKFSEADAPLYRMYAVLCLAKGNQTTDEDVHNAWCAWVIEKYPEHKDAVPFGELRLEVQKGAELWRYAILTASWELDQRRAA